MFKKIISSICITLLLFVSTRAAYEPSMEEVSAAVYLHEKWIISNYLIDSMWGMEDFKTIVRSSFSSTDSKYKKNVEAAVTLVVKNYRLWDTITRKEVAKIVVKIAGGEPAEKCEWKFKDVANDWGCKYIEWMLEKWYIKPAENFRPNDNITKSEAIKLLFKARGIQKIYNTDNWQKDYAMTAFDLGLSEIYTDYNVNAVRGWIFVIASQSYDEFKLLDEEVYTDEAL